MSDCTLPIHPYSGLRAVYVSPRTGRAFWPVRGGSEPPEPPPAPSTGAEPSWTPPTSQADLDRIVQNRLDRQQKQYGMTPDEVKALRERADTLDEQSKTDREKDISAARKEERAKIAPNLVRAEFKAAAKGVLTDGQLKALLEDLDLSRFLTDKGDVDEDRVTQKIQALAPAGTTTGHAPAPRPLGQGNRPSAKQSARDIASAEIARRYGTKTA